MNQPMVTITMPLQTAANTLSFLSRTKMEGDEAFAYCEIKQAINAAIQAAQAPSPEPIPVPRGPAKPEPKSKG
jgi:hypothetical protein